jgi:DivIVA domain-containing protein
MSPEPSPLDATGIARRHFPTVRKGYDPADVRAFLHELSDLVGRLQRGEAHQLERAERAEARAQLAEQLDEHRLVELLGAETARVLEAAREASADIRAKAEESAARMVRDAQGEAHAIIEQAERDGVARRREIESEAEQLRRDAEATLDRRRAEGQELADEMRRSAETERERMLSEGEQARVVAESEAERLRDAAREQGRQLVAEAQVVRERMLGDLARRRRTAREQLERLNAARERLLAAYEVVRRTVDEATVELTVALPQARAASESAARRVSEEPEPTVEEVEAELAVARMAGLLDDLDTDHDIDVDHIDALIDGEVQAASADAGAPSEPASEGQGERRGIWPFRRRPSEDQLEPVEPASDADAVVEPASEAVEDESAEGDATDVESIAGDDDVVDEDHDQVEELFARLKAGHDVPAGPGAAGGTDARAAAHQAGTAVAVMDDPSTSGADRPVVKDLAVEAADDATATETEDEGDADAEAEDVDPDLAVLRERDSRLEPVERELGRRLKRILADEQNEVFDLLRRVADLGGLDDVVPAAFEHAQRYADAALAGLDDAATRGAASVDGEAPGPCSGLACELGESLVEPMRERIARSLDECEGDLEEVTERLRSLYREWKGQRIGAAVRHYSAAAYAWGVYEATPPGAELRWLVDRSGEACPDADDNALAGGVSKGEPFPTGVLCSPAHPDCRCLVVPVGVRTSADPV